MPQQPGWSYSKWDKIADSDDSDDDGSLRKPVDATLASQKSNAVHEKDRAIARRFESHFERFNFVEKAHRGLVAHFVAVCDKGAEPNNIHRYVDILECCTRYGTDLLSLANVSALVELNQAMAKAAPKGATLEGGDPLLVDARLCTEAVNSLEAMRRVPNPTAFFEAVCTPSRNARCKGA